MRGIFTSLFCTAFIFLSHAQTFDTARINDLLHEVDEMYKAKKYQEAHIILDTIFLQSKKLDYQEGLGNAYFQRGRVYQKQGEWAFANRNYQKSNIGLG